MIGEEYINYDQFSELLQGIGSLAINFGLNKNLLEINLINLGVVLNLLVYFRKGMCVGCIFE
jgi:hypothetical protein